MSIDPVKLDKTFTILKPVEVQGLNGEVITTYEGNTTFAGMLIATSGSELHDANVERTEQRFQVVRQSSVAPEQQVTAKDRLSQGGKVFQVEYPRDLAGPASATLIDVVLLA